MGAPPDREERAPSVRPRNSPQSYPLPRRLQEAVLLPQDSLFLRSSWAPGSPGAHLTLRERGEAGGGRGSIWAGSELTGSPPTHTHKGAGHSDHQSHQQWPSEVGTGGPCVGSLGHHRPLGVPWLTQVGLHLLEVFRPAHVLEGKAGLAIEYVHLGRAARIQIRGPGGPGEAAGPGQ